MGRLAIAIAPFSDDGLVRAVEEAGGRIVDPAEARGVVWTNPGDPHALAELLAASPAEWVQLPFAGIESFVEAGVIDPQRKWTCAKGIYGHACAEHALALMLAAGRRLHHHIRNRKWEPGGLGRPEFRLKGKTAVLFGTGGIGAALVDMVAPLGMRVIGVNRSGRELAGAERTVSSERLVEVAAEADFLVLAAAVTAQTKGAVDARVIAALPEHAWIVNVARGVLIDTAALIDALEYGRVGGAALDVTEPEPLPDDHRLWDFENVIITPHIANTWDMALPDLVALVARNVANFSRERPLEGAVDVTAGY